MVTRPPSLFGDNVRVGVKLLSTAKAGGTYSAMFVGSDSVCSGFEAIGDLGRDQASKYSFETAKRGLVRPELLEFFEPRARHRDRLDGVAKKGLDQRQVNGRRNDTHARKPARRVLVDSLVKLAL